MSYTTDCDVEKTKTNTNIKSILSDLKYLTKGIVLYANVLPIVSGFWLGLFFAGESFIDHWQHFIYMMIGSTLVIAGALMYNNWYEVDLDEKMDRTQKRPTVTGNFSLRTVFILATISTIVGHIFLWYTTREAFAYGFIGWFTYVVLYTFWTKRKYTLNTVIGSISGAVTPLIGWAVVTSAYHIVPLMLFVILFIWQIPHTFAIAMRRHDDYKAANVPMLPVVAGFDITKRQNAIYIAALLPVPFFLTSLGTLFVVTMTFLNVAWLYISIKGVFSKGDDLKYANTMFYYSLFYLTIVFGLMLLIPLPMFQ